MTQKQNPYDEKTMSGYAQDLLQNMDPKPLYAEEMKTWDGVDAVGPEIILYDLYVIVDKSPSIEIPLYEYRYYHIEYYDPSEPIKYHLEKVIYHNLIDPELFTS
jgi:hypothetical protein